MLLVPGALGLDSPYPGLWDQRNPLKIAWLNPLKGKRPEGEYV